MSMDVLDLPLSYASAMACTDDQMDFSAETHLRSPTMQDIEIDFDIGDGLEAAAEEDENMIEPDFEIENFRMDHDDEMLDEADSRTEIQDEDIQDAIAEPERHDVTLPAVEHGNLPAEHSSSTTTGLSRYQAEPREQSSYQDRPQSDFALDLNDSTVRAYTDTGPSDLLTQANEHAAYVAEDASSHPALRTEGDSFDQLAEVEDGQLQDIEPQDLNVNESERADATTTATLDEFPLDLLPEPNHPKHDGHERDRDHAQQDVEERITTPVDVKELEPDQSGREDAVASRSEARLKARKSSDEHQPADEGDSSYPTDPKQTLDREEGALEDTEEQASSPGAPVHPINVHYQGSDMLLFARREASEDSEAYLLGDASLVEEPLNVVFEACRSVLEEDIGENQDLVIQFVSLGLEIQEVRSKCSSRSAN